ncbi:hypothetical protein CEP52_015531 [Fusarium oligoseptatum]|uniref:CFEM domain-containing protein n=1 Tax=Fusarium oligoseptatum TaxID=2604345 RepID=A0A428SC88_9HYPO|nr:hypothetical protein CEP52_015531 [Fusarium oligoseptatum]
MKSITLTSLLLLFGLASSSAQDTTKVSSDAASLTSASGAAATAGTSPELEKDRAECFQNCYRKYGSFPSCPLGKDKFFECWCGEDDWVEKEEDCVWNVCGVDAYNNYGDVQRSLCATVETTTSPPTEEQSTLTTGGSEMKISASAQIDSSTSETGTTSKARTASSTTSTAIQEETAEASQKPNGGVVGLASGAKAGLVVGVTYLVFMIL